MPGSASEPFRASEYLSLHAFMPSASKFSGKPTSLVILPHDNVVLNVSASCATIRGRHLVERLEERFETGAVVLHHRRRGLEAVPILERVYDGLHQAGDSGAEAPLDQHRLEAASQMSLAGAT
eukprot:7102430-Prymnesium_polylepis.1